MVVSLVSPNIKVAEIVTKYLVDTLHSKIDKMEQIRLALWFIFQYGPLLQTLIMYQTMEVIFSDSIGG